MNAGTNFFKKTMFFLLISSSGLTACTSCTLSHRRLSPPSDSIERLISGKPVEQEIDSLALPVINSGETVGMTIGVLYPDGQMCFYGYGKTDNTGDSQVPDGNTIFEIGSLSKLFVLSVYSSLLKEGVISENTTVRDIIPRSIILNDDMAAVTLKELATHTAGLPREVWTLEQFSHLMNYLFTGENLYSYMDKKWLYSFLKTIELAPKETRTYVYSNLGISLLSHLIEIRTGKPFYRLAEERVFKPLGMKDTVYKISDAQRKRLAKGHAGDQPYFMTRGTTVADWDMGDLMYPTGACYSTARDLLIFSMANLRITQNPLSAILRDMHKPRVSVSGEKFALGWSIDICGFNDVKILYKHGMVSGYSAYIGFNPESDTAVVALYNSFNWDEKIAHNLLVRLSSFNIQYGSRKKNIAKKTSDVKKISEIE